MGSWTIYNKNGVAKAIVKELELHDEWMAECFLTVTINSATPIQFGVGDYLDYRGERYTIEYDPNVIKRATSGTYGEGFVYDGIKFVGSQDEIVRCDFNDIVLSDNLHYTGLPTFPFYCESVDDLLDRIQANLEDLYPNQWIVIGLNTVRNSQRGSAVGRQTAFENAYKKWIDPDMTPHTDPYGKQSVAETADNITCWDALAKVHEDFGLNFIVRGKVVVVGTAGVFTANTFRYGKGNGLTEIEKVGDSSQQIVTRLRAYGSETNLPLHYYSAINMRPYGNVVEASATGIFQIDVDFDTRYFIHGFSSGETDIAVQIGSTTYSAKAYNNTTTGKININVLTAISVAANAKVYITEGVKRDMWPSDHKDYTQDALPENMAVSRLMLPMFPNTSLYDWVKAHRDTGTEYDDTTGLATYHGFTAYFSKEPHRPYIDSLNKAQYGVRPASIYFDGSNETDDIHPTIEGMTYNNVRIDAVYSADQISDSGVYDDSSIEVPNFHITLPDLGFNLAEVYEENASIDMKDGMCGGRSFKFASKPTQDSNGRWVCEVQRDKDENLNLFFPYSDFQITSGDHYVLTGIQMPDAYIEAAAVKLLDAALDALQKNEAPRFTYQPKIDKNFMQRQHDTAMSSQGVVSLHDSLKAGDVFVFADADMGVDASIIIDVLTIKENGDNGIPTYEVTLRDEKQVSTIQKIQNKIDSVINGAININSGVGGLTAQQVRSLINNYGGEQFLSKLNDDTAQGYITMLKGLQIGANFVPDILGEGGVLRMRQDGKVELVTDILYARMKAYFDTVEIREYQHTGGNRIASVAGNRMCRVEWYDANNQVLEQTSANLSSVAYFRCYFRAEDDETEVKNNWVVGDLAYCHVTSITNSSDNPEQKGMNQKHLWRLVIGRNTEGTLTEDGEAYIDLSNRSTETISGTSYTGYQSGSDAPEAQDDIIQLGNVNDTTRQGAIVEFVTGTDAPSYQIFQGIGQKVGSDASSIYSLTSKQQIGFGYNTSTGKAYLRVLGDAYIGASDRSTFIEYKQGDGTAQNPPQLNIKAVMQTLPSSTYEGKSASQFVQDNQIKYDSAIQNLTNITNDLQSQIDGQVETFFYNGTPSDSVLPESEWKAIDIAAGNNNERLKHLGDLYYDNQTGYAYRYSNSGSEASPVFFWNPISDSAVIKALTEAAAAFGLANTKAKTFTTASNTLPSPPYKTGDLWLNATGTWGSGDAAVTWNGDILKVKANINRASGDTPLISDWEVAGNYMNEQDFLDWKAGQYATDLTNAANKYLNDAVANAIKSALGSALGASTLTDGGLMLTSLIYLRKLNAGGDPTQVSDYTTWGGVSGEYDANAAGGGIAAWYGGNPVDKEVLQPDEPWDGTHHYRWARSLFRFDGSGYLADGNITWTAVGSMTIRNLTTIYGSQGGGVDVNTLSSLTSIFNTETYGTDPNTELLVKPQNAFSELFINRSGTAYANYPTDKSICDYSVLNFGEMKARFITKDWFTQFFVAHYKQNNVDKTLSPNEDFPQDATDKTLESVFSFWTNYGLTALGRGVSGSQVVSVLDDLNDVDLGSTISNNDVLTYDASTNKWTNKPAQGGSTVAALGDLTDVGISSLADKDILQYDYTNNVWKNVTLATALSGYATQSWVGQQGYITSAALSGYATQTWVGQQGYITGITSSMVTSALGYTPANSSSLSNYLPLSGGTMTGTLHFTTSAALPRSTSVSNFLVLDDFADGGTVKWASADAIQSALGLGSLAYKSSLSANDIPALNYLPLSGGTISSGSRDVLALDNVTTDTAKGPFITFKINGSTYGFAGYYYDGSLDFLFLGAGTNRLFLDKSGGARIGTDNTNYTIYHTGNLSPITTTNWSSYIGTSSSYVGYASYATSAGSATTAGSATSATYDSAGNVISSTYVKLTANGAQTISNSGVDSQVLTLKGYSTYSSIAYYDSSNNRLGIIGVDSTNGMYFYDSALRKVWHSGNSNGIDKGQWSATSLALNGAISGATNITASGNVGIGVNNPAYKLEIDGNIRICATYASHSIIYRFVNHKTNPWGLIIRTEGSYGGFSIQNQRESDDSECFPILFQPYGGNIGIGLSQGLNPSYKLHVVGDIYATGGVTSLSDIRKKDVLSYELPLSVEQIAAAPTIKFLWKDKREGGEQVGTIAQYWEKVLPQVCKDKSGELSMGYGVTALIAATIDARKIVDHEKLLREQAAKISELENKCSFLEREVERLKCA